MAGRRERRLSLRWLTALTLWMLLSALPTAAPLWGQDKLEVLKTAAGGTDSVLKGGMTPPAGDAKAEWTTKAKTLEATGALNDLKAGPAAGSSPTPSVPATSEPSSSYLTSTTDLKPQTTYEPSEVRPLVQSPVADPPAGGGSPPVQRTERTLTPAEKSRLTQAFVLDVSRHQVAVARNDHGMALQIAIKWQLLGAMYPSQIDEITQGIARLHGFQNFRDYITMVENADRQALPNR